MPVHAQTVFVALRWSAAGGATLSGSGFGGPIKYLKTATVCSDSS